ncbi:MAG: selenium metabolism-associated LysR family transcriptional regulator [Deferrisomatales bacterium]
MQAPRIHVSQLITFYFVARDRSITSASEALCLTQPAVSKQIKALEEQFGVKLIHVVRRRVVLTEEGERLFPHAEAACRAALGAERLLRFYGGGGVLRIGVAAALTLYLVRAIDRFKERYPSVRVTVREGPSLEVVRELRDFRHDLCLVASLREPAPDLDVHHVRLTEQVVFVSAPGNPLAKRRQVGWEDLEERPLILQGEGSMARKLVLEEFRKRHLSPRIAAEIDNVAGMKELVAQGKGIAPMTRPNVAEELARGTLVALPLDPGEAGLGIDVVLRRTADRSPLCDEFLDLLRGDLEEEEG